MEERVRGGWCEAASGWGRNSVVLWGQADWQAARPHSRPPFPQAGEGELVRSRKRLCVCGRGEF